MRSQGIRRLPVVTGNGHLVGILTADDVLELLTDGLTWPGWSGANGNGRVAAVPE